MMSRLYCSAKKIGTHLIFIAVGAKEKMKVKANAVKKPLNPDMMSLWRFNCGERGWDWQTECSFCLVTVSFPVLSNPLKWKTVVIALHKSTPLTLMPCQCVTVNQLFFKCCITAWCYMMTGFLLEYTHECAFFSRQTLTFSASLSLLPISLPHFFFSFYFNLVFSHLSIPLGCFSIVCPSLRFAPSCHFFASALALSILTPAPLRFLAFLPLLTSSFLPPAVPRPVLPTLLPPHCPPPLSPRLL